MNTNFSHEVVLSDDVAMYSCSTLTHRVWGRSVPS